MEKKQNIAQALTLVVRKNPEGFTFNLQALAPQKNGFAVALEATQNSFGPKGLAKVIRYALSNNIPCIGGWRDSETGLYYFDATMVVDTLAEAIRLGKANHQKAIYDINTNTEIRL